jgi:hypothetical protein
MRRRIRETTPFIFMNLEFSSEIKKKMGNGLKPFYFHVVFIGCYWKVDEYKAIVEF